MVAAASSKYRKYRTKGCGRTTPFIHCPALKKTKIYPLTTKYARVCMRACVHITLKSKQHTTVGYLTVFQPTPVVYLFAQSPAVGQDLRMLGYTREEVRGTTLVHTQHVEVRQAAQPFKTIIGPRLQPTWIFIAGKVLGPLLVNIKK